MKYTDIIPNADPALKGKQNGNCNRQACQQAGATWFNQGTEAFYCRACAKRINSYQDERINLQLYGTVDLCIDFAVYPIKTI